MAKTVSGIGPRRVAAGDGSLAVPRGFVLAIAWVLLLSLCRAGLADSLFVGSLERKNVLIRDLKDGMVVYEINGRASEIEAGKVTRLLVSGEPALTAAEQAYAAAEWDQAVDGYQKAIRTTSKPWVKSWAAQRLIDAANRTGRFDAAATAYILVLLEDPNRAAGMKPAMPQSGSTYLDTAVQDVNNAMNDPKLTVEQRRALLGFLVELHQARKDAAAEDAAYEQLARLPGADVNDPGARRILAKRKLSVASRALDAADYLKAINEIEASKAIFTEPAQQADALFIIAQARHGLATGQPDAKLLKDAALAYMRVVALAKDEPGRPHVVQSLLSTADILQQLGEPASARQLYEQVLAQYGDDPDARHARDALNRLNNPRPPASGNR
ncbi:tetratricopeptide repeat protein [Fontivita pretiosa]|uniref:tetratricopeptide repeat protein n=1 Tax=Fontivita pretiosa TaxID=2989684 RepID=UPI003D16A8AD